MKKLCSGLAAALVIFGLAACGPTNSSSTDDSKPGPDVNETKVLVDNDVEGYIIAGPDTHKVGDTFIKNWGEFDGTSGKMTATSIGDIRTADAKLADNLIAKKTVALYKLEDVHVATEKLAGWTTKYGEDEKEIDGAYALKCATWAHDEENDVDVLAQWIPDPHSPKAISLTPDTFWTTSNYAEEKDEHGYDWTTNPVITSGAGTYTIVLAKFAENVEDAPYGIGAIKTAEGSEFVPAEFKNWHITGQFAGDANVWKESAADEKYQFSAEGVLDFTFAVDDEFKITKFLTDNTGDWGGALDFTKVKSVDPEGAFAQAGEENTNIKCVKAGTYTLTVTGEGETLALTIVAKAA